VSPVCILERLIVSTVVSKCVGFTFGTVSLAGTAVAQWLRRCATNPKVAGSIPAGVIGIFH